MLSNYLLTAYRSLIGQKLYSAINILGLAIGLAACIMMAIFVESELGYDTYHKDYQQLYRTSVKMTVPGAPEQNFAPGQASNAPTFKADFEEIVDSTRLRGIGATLTAGQDSYNDDGVMLADANVFNVLTFEFIHGDAQTALSSPDTIVLTRSMAEKYFKTTNVIGKTLTLGNSIELKVTAVVEDLPERTHLQVSSLISMPTAAQYLGEPDWEENPSFNFYTYLKLADGVSGAVVEAKIPDYLENKVQQGISDLVHFSLVPITDIYLTSHIYGEMKENGDIKIVMSFSIIALLILLIACINFMNLSTATAAKRAKEVGVRKVLGANTHNLVYQFICEAILISFCALIISVALVEAFLPAFSTFIGKSLTFAYLSDLGTLFTLIAVGLSVGVLAGLYPAFYLSAFKPAKVLKGEVTQGKSGALLRKALVIMQFSVAIVLIVSTIIAQQQLSYARNIDLGYDKENVMILTRLYTAQASEQASTLKSELLSHPDITHVTGTSRYPTGTMSDSYNLTHPVTNENQLMPVLGVDYDYLTSYRIKLIAGRGFDRAFSADEAKFPSKENPEVNIGVVINETAAKSLGWSAQEAVGKQFLMPFGDGMQLVGNIVGVTEDYYFSSLKTEIGPMFHLLRPNTPYNMSIKYTGETSQISEYVNKVWSTLLPEQPISLRYLDDEFNTMYAEEDQQMIVFNLFSGLAIFIACMGLFGLASFTTQRRTKEIGIRKVLGATVMDIVVLLSKEFSKQVLIANVIAWPIAYYLMREWLNNFVYRIDLSVIPFVLSTVIAFIIAWLTVGSIAALAAQSRPIKSLRYE